MFYYIYIPIRYYRDMLTMFLLIVKIYSQCIITISIRRNLHYIYIHTISLNSGVTKVTTDLYFQYKLSADIVHCLNHESTLL